MLPKKDEAESEQVVVGGLYWLHAQKYWPTWTLNNLLKPFFLPFKSDFQAQNTIIKHTWHSFKACLLTLSFLVVSVFVTSLLLPILHCSRHEY